MHTSDSDTADGRPGSRIACGARARGPALKRVVPEGVSYVHVPDQIGPYRPRQVLGAGGMGTVYLASDPRGGAPVAVKVLGADHTADPGYRARFAREVALMRKVQGPFLVALTDADPTADRPWLAMPYIPGRTLDRHVAQLGPLGGAELVTFATAVAHALSCVHAAGIAHRDLKPSNVILAVDGPRVLDFGIAHHLDATAITATSVRTGTPMWMAPEQLSSGATTQATDVFAWGMLVAYAASGLHPFGSPTGISHRIEASAPDLSSVPGHLLPLVTEALHKSPDERPTAVDLARRCAALLAEPTGTAVFPTLAYTRLDATAPNGNESEAAADAAAAAGTVVLPPWAWNVPGPDADPTRLLPRSDSDSGRRANAPDAPPAPPSSGATYAAGWAPPAAPPHAHPQAHAQPTAWEPMPGRPTRRPAARALALGGAGLLVVVAAIGAVALDHHGGEAGPGSGMSASAPSVRLPTSTSPSPSASAGASPTASPSPTGSPTASPSPTAQTVSFFGGLQATVPGDWVVTQIPAESLTYDDGTDTKFAMSLAPASGDGASGLAVEFTPGLASVTGDTNANGIGILDGRFAQGPSDSGGSAQTQTVTDLGAAQSTTVAGLPAQTWRVHTDQEPDYNGTRKATQSVWYLPHARYLLYTYGTLTNAQQAQAQQIVAALRLGSVAMPLDCADAVDQLDTSAAGGNVSQDDPTQSCVDLVLGGSSGALDPGTIDTTTESSCLVLVYEYSVAQVQGDATYPTDRHWCGLPNKS
ncbi:serine/threonine-protein kinase [Streptacidiphilus jiangxiensis]|nr:serine/threonine-protein kinase [Streptacidiphilus jiangxiensis]